MAVVPLAGPGLPEWMLEHEGLSRLLRRSSLFSARPSHLHFCLQLPGLQPVGPGRPPAPSLQAELCSFHSFFTGAGAGWGCQGGWGSPFMPVFSFQLERGDFLSEEWRERIANTRYGRHGACGACGVYAHGRAVAMALGSGNGPSLLCWLCQERGQWGQEGRLSLTLGLPLWAHKADMPSRCAQQSPCQPLQILLAVSLFLLPCPLDFGTLWAPLAWVPGPPPRSGLVWGSSCLRASLLEWLAPTQCAQ